VWIEIAGLEVRSECVKYLAHSSHRKAATRNVEVFVPRFLIELISNESRCYDYCYVLVRNV
jgi:hypothetical protein